MPGPHFTPILRRLWKQRGFSLLNILGLAVGIGACLLIFLVIRYETGFDRFYSQYRRIYRVATSSKMNGGDPEYFGCSPMPVGDAVRRDFPQFEQVASVWSAEQSMFTVPGKPGMPERKFRMVKGAFYSTPSLFRIFDFGWLSGNPDESLKAPHTAALTKSVAESWFGDWQNAIGKTFFLGDNKTPFLVSGILRNPPPNTDIPLQIALSYASVAELKDLPIGDWTTFNSKSETFALLGKDQDIRSAESGIPAFSAAHFNVAAGFSSLKASIFFQPLKDMHFDSRLDTFGNPGISLTECWALGLIGGFLVLIACVNFINLSTAQSLARSREIGVRKVLGSGRLRLVKQFLGETGLLVGVALLLAVILSILVLPALNTLMEKHLTLDFSDPSIGLFLIVLGISVTLLAGFYPGFVLSGFAPITAIRNKIGNPKGGSIWLRRGLVVMQFAIAQILLIGTLVVVKQMNFFRRQPMGFEQKAIALVDIPGNQASRSKLANLRARILQLPGVEQASLCSDPPSRDGSWNLPFAFDTRQQPESFYLSTVYADTGYLATFGMKLLAGRYPAASDTMKELLVNETALKMLRLKDPSDILNKPIRIGGDGSPYSPPYPVVGVLADFNSKPLREKIGPLLLSPVLDAYQKLAVRFDPHRIDATLPQVQAVFSQTFPEHIFEYFWTEDAVANFYKGEAMMSTLFKIFSVIAILISCLGLYGLVSLMAVQKTKEVGIRKVLGASVGSIIYLFSREFTRLVGIAFLVAAPLGWAVMHGWLNGFYYRTVIGWEIFAGALGLSILVAWISVSYKAARAALANPVKSLKTE
ncbi:MAG: ABC transporter permease [Puia sp.]|nr:ABC transporter permease [Puia sp.]